MCNLIPTLPSIPESPAWAVDRLSILALKIYHMQKEAERKDSPAELIENAVTSWKYFFQQKTDLATAIEQLLDDIKKGNKYMKVYKQMKMYNDPNLNPVLYAQK